MPLSGITTVVQQGGIGRRAPNNDKISGLLWWSDTLPSGWSADGAKKVFTLEEAEALGILSTVSAVAILHYHVSEYFRINPVGELWIGIYGVPAGAYDWAEITSLMDASAGEIRQMAVHTNDLAYVASQVTAIQAVVAAMYPKGYRFSVLYAPDFTAETLSTIADLRALNAPAVAVCLGEDGGGVGAALAVTNSFSTTCVGAMLGAVSKAKVQQSIGNPSNFDISDGSELEVLALAEGTLLSAISDTLLGALKDKGYTVVRKYTPRLGGSFFERVPTCVAATNDFAWLEYVRTIDKAARGVEAILMPTIQAGVKLNGDGTLTNEVLGYYKDLAGQVLVQMMADGEISGSPSDIKNMVLIDPSQKILATSTLVITIKIIPIGITEFITLNIGLTTSV